MEAITLLIALSMSPSGGPAKPASAAVIGTWKVQLSQEVRDSARKMGMPEPQAQFVFSGDKTYAYASSFGAASKTCSGTYEISDHAVKLSALNNSWPSGITADLKDDNSMDVDGLHYAKADAAISLAGTWFLCNAGGQDKSTKIVFDKNGNFSFEGSFASSKGKYTSDGSSVTLKWTEIDGGDVDFGSVHKTIPLNSDGSLQIDAFRYQKQ